MALSWSLNGLVAVKYGQIKKYCGSSYPTMPRYFFLTPELFPWTASQSDFLFCSCGMAGAWVIKHGSQEHTIMLLMISFSKCDHARETQKIGAFPPLLSICELFEEEHSSYDTKLSMINVSTSIENQLYDLQLNLMLSDITVNFKEANNTFRCNKQNKDIL